MFTGLVQDIGKVASISHGRITRIKAATNLNAEEFTIGESIAMDGVCLTVVSRGHGYFEVEASPETLRCTTVGEWSVGADVHLERALRLSDRLGGHLVSGHVDAVSRIVDKKSEGEAMVLGVELQPDIAHLIVEKGSVAINGVSLTVNKIENHKFFVSLIPQTQQLTRLANKPLGGKINLETDLIGKYVARLLDKNRSDGSVNENLLKRCGFV